MFISFSKRIKVGMSLFRCVLSRNSNYFLTVKCTKLESNKQEKRMKDEYSVFISVSRRIKVVLLLFRERSDPAGARALLNWSARQIIESPASAKLSTIICCLTICANLN